MILGFGYATGDNILTPAQIEAMRDILAPHHQQGQRFIAKIAVDLYEHMEVEPLRNSQLTFERAPLLCDFTKPDAAINESFDAGALVWMQFQSWLPTRFTVEGSPTWARYYDGCCKQGPGGFMDPRFDPTKPCAATPANVRPEMMRAAAHMFGSRYQGKLWAAGDGNEPGIALFNPPIYWDGVNIGDTSPGHPEKSLGDTVADRYVPQRTRPTSEAFAALGISVFGPEAEGDGILDRFLAMDISRSPVYTRPTFHAYRYEASNAPYPRGAVDRIEKNFMPILQKYGWYSGAPIISETDNEDDRNNQLAVIEFCRLVEEKWSGYFYAIIPLQIATPKYFDNWATNPTPNATGLAMKAFASELWGKRRAASHA